MKSRGLGDVYKRQRLHQMKNLMNLYQKLKKKDSKQENYRNFKLSARIAGSFFVTFSLRFLAFFGIINKEEIFCEF